MMAKERERAKMREKAKAKAKISRATTSPGTSQHGRAGGRVAGDKGGIAMAPGVMAPGVADNAGSGAPGAPNRFTQ